MDQVLEGQGTFSEDDSNVVDIPAGDPKDPAMPERRFIPDAARSETLQLFNKYLELAKKADVARTAFTDFLNVVRRDLGIADNEFWVPSEDAMYFEKQAAPVAPAGMETVQAPEVPSANL